MTPTEAAALHARESANHGLIVWIVTLSDPAHPGRVVAYARVGDPRGGYRARGELVADTIEAVRGMLPVGLERMERTPFDAVGTVEVWVQPTL